MGRTVKLGPETVNAILGDLRAGKSQTSIAKQYHVGSASVNRIAKANGLEYSRANKAPVVAIRAHRDYAKAERLWSINVALGRIMGFWESEDLKPQHVAALAIAHATMIDKRRLEEGQPTNRSEVNRSTLTLRLAAISERLRAPVPDPARKTVSMLEIGSGGAITTGEG